MCGGHHDDYNNRRKGVGGGGEGEAMKTNKQQFAKWCEKKSS
jgi:hypothetical protein